MTERDNASHISSPPQTMEQEYTPEQLEEKLTKGICSRLSESIPADNDEVYTSRPIVQLLSIKKVNTGNAAQTDRHRVIISDGAHFIQAMLATQLNPLIENDTIGRYSVIQLERFIVNFVQNRRYKFFILFVCVLIFVILDWPLSSKQI